MITAASQEALESGKTTRFQPAGYEGRPEQIAACLKKLALSDQGEWLDRFSVPSIQQLMKHFRCDEITVVDALNNLMMEGYDYTADDPESSVTFTRTPSSEMLRRFRWWNWPSLYRYEMAVHA